MSKSKQKQKQSSPAIVNESIRNEVREALNIAFDQAFGKLNISKKES